MYEAIHRLQLLLAQSSIYKPYSVLYGKAWRDLRWNFAIYSSKHLLIFASLVFLLSGCGESDSRSSTSSECGQCKELSAQISSLNDEKAELTNQANEKQVEIDKLSKLIDSYKKERGNRFIYFILIACWPVMFIAGMFLKSLLLTKKPTFKSKLSLTECPKCHAKLDPNSDKCPNKECNLRLR